MRRKLDRSEVIFLLMMAPWYAALVLHGTLDMLPFLTGNVSGVCPDCGTPTEKTGQSSESPRPVNHSGRAEP